MRGSSSLKPIHWWVWLFSWMFSTVENIPWSDFRRARLLLCAVLVDSSEVRRAYLCCDLCSVGVHVVVLCLWLVCVCAGGLLEETAAPTLGSTRKQLRRTSLEKSMGGGAPKRNARSCPALSLPTHSIGGFVVECLLDQVLATSNL